MKASQIYTNIWFPVHSFDQLALEAQMILLCLQTVVLFFFVWNGPSSTMYGHSDHWTQTCKRNTTLETMYIIMRQVFFGAILKAPGGRSILFTILERVTNVTVGGINFGFVFNSFGFIMLNHENITGVFFYRRQRARDRRRQRARDRRRQRVKASNLR